MDLSLIKISFFIVKVFSKADKDYIQNSAEFPEHGLGDEEDSAQSTSPCSSSRGYYAGAKSKTSQEGLKRSNLQGCILNIRDYSINPLSLRIQ